MIHIANEQLQRLFAEHTGYEVDYVFLREFKRWMCMQGYGVYKNQSSQVEYCAWLRKYMRRFVGIPGVV